MKKFIKVFTVVLTVIILLACVASIFMGKYVADQILHQNKGINTKENSIKQLEVWGYDLVGFLNECVGRDVVVTAKDGNIVPATYFEAEEDSGIWVVLVHGAGGDRACIYPLAEEYLKRGYNVIAYDQRGSGDNADARVSFGILESIDLDAVVRYTFEELQAKKVYAHGQSMGAQTVSLYASGAQKTDNYVADAVILDSPIPGMELLLRLMFGDGPEGADSFMTNYLIFTSKTYMKLVYHIDFDDADTVERAKNNTIPTMVIVSDRDEVCFPYLVEEIYDNIVCNQKKMEHFDSKHIEGVIDSPKEYMESVVDFLKEVGLQD